MSAHNSRFDYSLPYHSLNIRAHPELYRIGIGEQGVLLVEPYKSEILPFWKFRTPEIASASAQQIFLLFLSYLYKEDFIGADMARKFLQMGFTRARRYANHPSGKKYRSNPQKAKDKTEERGLRKHDLPQAADWRTNQKAQSAQIFYNYYLQARENLLYQKLRKTHKNKYER